MKTKNTVKYYYASSRVAEVMKTGNNEVLGQRGATGTLTLVDGTPLWYNYLENSLVLITKLKHLLSPSSFNPRYISIRNMNIGNKRHAQGCLQALFITALNWKPP